MPKKELTASVARDIAILAEDGLLQSLGIRPRLSGKNKGRLFAEYQTFTNAEDVLLDHNTERLIHTLNDAADRIDNGEPIDLTVQKDESNQFISYTRGAK